MLDEHDLTELLVSGQGSARGSAMSNALPDLLDAAAAAGLVPADGAEDVDRLRTRCALGMLPAQDAARGLNRLLAVGPAADMALDTVALLFDHGDVIELRALDPDGGGSLSLSGRLDAPGDRTRLRDFIRTHNGLRNLYVGVCPRGADLAGTTRPAQAADVTARRSVVIDLDTKDAPATDPGWTRTRAELSALGPSHVVDSGNGWHYWFAVETLAGADLATSCGPLAGAMARLGADNMADPARIARLTHTVNLPTPLKRSRGATARLALPVTGAQPAAATRAAGALANDLAALADRLALPGRQSLSGAGNVASRVGTEGQLKTGWAAPSANVLRMALDRLPNDPGGPFDGRDAWAAFGNAVKGAAVAGGCEAEGLAAWLDWSARWGGDPREAERFWTTCTAPHAGWGYIMRTLEQINPAGAADVRDAAARAAFTQEAAINRAVIAAAGLAPARAIAPATIPPRPWLYGRSVIAGFVSILAAPGGQGKSSLMMTEAVAMAAGRELLSGEKPVRPLRVWYHGAEDDLTEAERRLAATLSHFNLTHADLGDRLFLSSGRGMKIMLGRMGREGAEPVPGVIDGLVGMVKAAGIDVIVFDPLGAMLGVPENDNTAANIILDALREIAKRTGAAVILLHHSAKSAAADMDRAGAGAVRGASSFVDGARVVRQLVRMTPEEAARFGIKKEHRREYLRAEMGKANLSRAEGSRWLRLVSVGLGNGAGLWPQGDYIGVAERWTPPTAMSGTVSDLAAVQAALTAMAPVRPRADHRARDYAGYVVADVLGLDIGQAGTAATDRTPAQAGTFARVRAMVDGWVASGGLVRVTEHDHRQGRGTTFITPGTEAIICPEASGEAAGAGQDSPQDEDGGGDFDVIEREAADPPSAGADRAVDSG